MADSSFLGAIQVSFVMIRPRSLPSTLHILAVPVYEGGARDANNYIKANLYSTTGITFGDDGAWAWFNKNSWQCGNAIDPNINNWIFNMKKTLGDNCRPVFGPGGATVLLYYNGVSMNCMTSAVTFINVGHR